MGALNICFCWDSFSFIGGEGWMDAFYILTYLEDNVIITTTCMCYVA